MNHIARVCRCKCGFVFRLKQIFMKLTPEQIEVVKRFQKIEITGYEVYRIVAKQQRNNKPNQDLLNRIADDELNHYNWLRKLSGVEVNPSRFQIFKFGLISKIFGPTFAIKLLEKAEEADQKAYEAILNLPQVQQIIRDEESHEKELIAMVSEEKLNYMGSVVLGLNDALVELTGALAGLTFALQNPQLIALTGSITGIAAAFSMAASEYLSTKSEDTGKHALKASWYTGLAYMITVILLILPFLLIDNVYVSLSITLCVAVCIIAGFNYFYAIVRDEKFKSRFSEMVILSFSVAALSFGVGWVLRHFFNLDI